LFFLGFELHRKNSNYINYRKTLDGENYDGIDGCVRFFAISLTIWYFGWILCTRDNELHFLSSICNKTTYIIISKLEKLGQFENLAELNVINYYKSMWVWNNFIFLSISEHVNLLVFINFVYFNADTSMFLCWKQ
jgi:hypothetical protein